MARGPSLRERDYLVNIAPSLDAGTKYAEGRVWMTAARGSSRTVDKYRSLSSIARLLLPRAQEMHQRGMSWEMVAVQLQVSPSALYLWRKLAR